MRCTRISRLRLWKPSNFDFDLRWPLTAPIRVHSFAAAADDERRGRLNFGDPTKKVHAHKWPRAVENRKKHEFHAVHSCRSHTHFRESQGELRRAGWMPSFLVWPHSNHVAKVAVSIPNHDFLSLYLGRARTKRPRPPRLLLRQKSSLSHKNPSCPLSLPFFLYSPLCKLLHFDANLIPFLSVSISC